MTIKEKLIKKIEEAKDSEQLLQEVYDFLQFLEKKEEQMAIYNLSEQKLESIWNNDEDEIYDQYL